MHFWEDVIYFCTTHDDKITHSNQTLHKIGYANISSVGQNLDSQLDTLNNVGCQKIFTGYHDGFSDGSASGT